MQTKCTSVFAAAFAALTLATFAAAPTPVAVWDGDFSAVQTGYTLNLNGNTLGDGNSSVTIDQAVGVTVTSDSTFASGFTVLVEYSGLDTSLHAKQVLATSTLTDAANRTGATIDTAGKSCGIWAGASWNSSGTYNSMTSSQSSGILVFSHYSTTSFSGTGTQLYYIAPDTLAGTTILNAGTLGSNNDKSKYKGFSIGGSSAAIDGFSAATGMKISKIAVFSGVPGLKSIQAYCAGTKNLQVSADKTFSEILDDAGITSSLAPYTSLEITTVNTPTITFDVAGAELYALTVNGSAVFDMDSSLYENGSFSKKLLTVGDSISAPDATYNVNADWKGAFVQSSDSITLYAQNAETISINIGGGNGTSDTSADANLVTGNGYYGLYPTPGAAWNNISGQWQDAVKTVMLTSAKAFDGADTTVRNTIQLSGKAKNTWLWDGTSVPYLRGYLDDTDGVEVKIVGVPYSVYDVIIYATSDNSQKQLNYFTINGENYTCGSDGIATVGTSAWGVGQTKTAQFGKNAMLVQGITGSTLTISGTRTTNSDGSAKDRVTVCAVQIINKGVVESSDWSANLNETTTFAGGTGTGLSEQSGTWVNGSLASITLTNNAETATLTLDGEIVAGTLKIVGAAGKKLFIDKAQDATLDIAVYNLTESAEEATFLFNPDFSKVNAGANLIGVGYDYTGAVGSGFHYIGSANTLTLGTVDGSGVNIGGGGTITNNLDVIGGATVTLSGTYTTSGFSRLGATKGVVVVDSGADVTFTSVMLANSDNGENYNRLDVNGTLRVSSVSTTSNVYSKRNDYEGILFGHWKGTSTVNVGAGGGILAENAWMQLSYSTNSVVTINGGAVKIAGINGGPRTTDFAPELTLTGGGCLEFAESPINMDGVVRNYGYGTIKTYSYNGSTGWTDPGSITFIDATNGTTIDPCGMADVFSGALSGAGKIVVSDSVGGGSVSFTGDANDLSGDIVVAANTTLNLGTARPTGTMTVNGTLAVVLINKADVPVFKVSANPVSVILYDTDGETVLSGANVEYNADEGTITVKSYPIWATETESGSFDTAANWSTGSAPASGDAAIVLAQDTTISISGTYTLSSLTISGVGKATLADTGSITVDNVYILGGTALAHGGQIIATSVAASANATLVLDAGKGTLTESAVISGAGAVETYGNVTMATNNSYTGGTTVKTGLLSSTKPRGYGPFTTGMACSAQSCVTVEDGACVSLDNIINDGNAYRLVIAGKGLVRQDGTYSGAVVYTQGACGSTVRQISSITLASDALVDLGNGWGLVHHEYGTANLALAGHTLTVRGAGSSVFPMQNVTALSSGTIVVENATLQLAANRYGRVSNLTNVNIVAKGATSIDFTSTATAIGSLTLKPSASGTTASSWNLPSGCVPTLDTSNVDPSGLTVGQELTLFTAPSATELTAETIAVKAGGRYTTTISGNTVTATVGDALSNPFLHYDFENGAAIDTGKAPDSRTQISGFGENSGPLFVNGCKGKAVRIRTPGYTPYWDTNVSGVSPFVAGEVTVSTVAKLKETGIVLWGLGNTNDSNPAMGLVATNTSVSVVTRNTSGTEEKILMLQVTSDLTKGWHFFAVVANAKGTTLYVDDLSASTDKTISFAIGQQGQLGSFHGGAIGASKVGSDGYYLDDWRVYDAALTEAEVRLIKGAICPDPFIIRFR